MSDNLPVNIFSCPHPFSNKRYDHAVIAGATLSEILTAIDLKELLNPAMDVRLFVEDKRIRRNQWESFVPEAGQSVAVRVLPTGGDTNKVARTVALVAVMALSIYAAGPAGAAAAKAWGTAAGGLVSAGVQVGVGIVGALAVNALIPVPNPESSDDGIGSTLNLTGIRNRANLYGAVPRIFGTHKIYPPLAAEPYTETGNDAVLRMLLCIGQGEYDVTDIKIGETDIDQYEGVDYSVGFKDDISDIYTNDYHTQQLSIHIEKIGGNWYYQTTVECTEISVDLTFPNGIWEQTDSGKVRKTSVEVYCQYRLNGSGDPYEHMPGHPGGPGTGMSPHTFKGNWKHLFTRSFRVGNLAKGIYDVRIHRETDSFDEDNKPGGIEWVNDEFYWTGLKSINYGEPFTLDGVTLLSVMVNKSEDLNGVIDQLNCMATAKVPAWTGSAWSANAATRSPAWAYAEVLRGDANLRALADNKINGDDLLSWATACTAAGLYFDAIVDAKTTVFELLRKIAAVGRAAFAIVDNKYTIVRDILQTVPRQHFSPRNSWGFAGHKTFVDVPHGLRCRFKNADADNGQILVFDDGYNEDNATLYETMDFWGVTTADHIWKLARYHIAVAKLRPESFEILTDIEWIVCMRGDLVRLTHDVVLVGLGQARITDISGSDVTMDNSITMSGGSYGAQIRKSDGTMLDTTIASGTGEYTTVTLGSVSGVAVGDLIFYGETGAESIDCIVNRIEPGPDMSARLTLIPAAPGIHDADTGEIPDYDPVITMPPVENRIPPTPNIENVTLSMQAIVVDNNSVRQLTATVDFSLGIATDITPYYFQAQHRTVESGPAYGDWLQMDVPLNARHFDVPVEDGMTYDFRVRSVSQYGATSAWDTESSYLITYNAAVPNDVVGLALVNGTSIWTGRDVILVWGEPADTYRVAQYQLNIYKTSPLTLLRTEYHPVGTLNADYTFDENVEDNSGTPVGSLTFRIWTVSTLGELSDSYDELVVTHAPPASVTSLGGVGYRGGVLFTWDDNTDEAFSHFGVQLKVENDSPSSWTSQRGNYHSRPLTIDEVDDHGADATITIYVKSVDIFGTESGTSSTSEEAETLNVQITDIDDFAIDASALWPRIPVLQGFTITNDDPDTNSISWDQHTLVYDGVEYTIAADDTNKKYVYWKDKASTYSSSDAHPGDNLGDWNPGEDFIIAVNIEGSGQAAWNAIANQVVGSSWIMDAAIQDLHVDNISGDKIIANTITLTGIASDVTYQMSSSYNLVKNGEFKKDESWDTNPQDWIVSVIGNPLYRMAFLSLDAPWDKNNGMCFYGRTNSSDDSISFYSEGYIPIDENLDYCLSCWLRGVTGVKSFYLGLKYYDGSYAPMSPAYNYPTASNYSPANTWHQIHGVCYNSASAETYHFPAGTKYVKVFCIVQYLGNVGGNLVSRISLQEGLYPSRGITVIDGGHIYTGTVTANEIAANTITSDEIAANAITADEIEAGAITLTGLDSEVLYQMATAYNLVKNGEFKKDENTETNPEDWIVTKNGTPSYCAVVIPTPPTAEYVPPWDRNNAKVFYVNCDAANEYGRLVSDDYIPIDEFKDYCLSAWVYGYTGTRRMYLGLYYYDSDYAGLSPAYNYPVVTDYSPATSWHQIEGVIYNSSSAAAYKFPVGTCYVKVLCFVQYQAVGACMISRIVLNEGHYPQKGITVIDGGNIYTDTISASQINGDAFGELTISSGKIAINTTDALEINANGNILVNSGADIRMQSVSGNSSEINFIGGATTYTLGVDYNNDRLTLAPDTDGTGYLLIGKDWDGTTKRLQRVDIAADDQLHIDCDGGDHGEIHMQQNQMTLGHWQRIEFNCAITPNVSGGENLGHSSYYWDTLFAEQTKIFGNPGSGVWQHQWTNTQATSPYTLLLDHSGAAGGGYFIYCTDYNSTNFYVTGQGKAYAVSHDTISDVSLKENIVDCDPQLERLLKLDIRNFNWKTRKDEMQIGMVSQEVEPIIPEIITAADNGIKAINQSALLPIVVKAIQELNQKIEKIGAQS